MLSSFKKDKTDAAGLPQWGSFTGLALSGEKLGTESLGYESFTLEQARELDYENDLPRGRREAA